MLERHLLWVEEVRSNCPVSAEVGRALLSLRYTQLQAFPPFLQEYEAISPSSLDMLVA